MLIFDADTPLTYQSKTSIVNNQKAMNEMKRNNKCHEANDEIGLNMCLTEMFTDRRDKHRETFVNAWTQQGKVNFYTTDIPIIYPSQHTYIYECPENFSHVLYLI